MIQGVSEKPYYFDNRVWPAVELSICAANTRFRNVLAQGEARSILTGFPGWIIGQDVSGDVV